MKDFKTAYLQSALFLMAATGLTGSSSTAYGSATARSGASKGMEDVPYVKPWKAVLTKRSLATVLYLIFSFAAAGIVVLIGKIG